MTSETCTGAAEGACVSSMFASINGGGGRFETSEEEVIGTENCTVGGVRLIGVVKPKDKGEVDGAACTAWSVAVELVPKMSSTLAWGCCAWMVRLRRCIC